MGRITGGRGHGAVLDVGGNEEAAASEAVAWVGLGQGGADGEHGAHREVVDEEVGAVLLLDHEGEGLRAQL